ncbi:MAG: tetratricopeptide repeat protein [Bacteroidota bacterium]
MMKKVKKIKKSTQVKNKVQGVTKNASKSIVLIVKSEQSALIKWFDALVEKSGLKLFIINTNPTFDYNGAAKVVTGNPQAAVNQIKETLASFSNTKILKVAPDISVAEIEALLKWHKQQKTDVVLGNSSTYFVEKTESGIVQKILLFIINFLYGFKLNGFPKEYVLIEGNSLIAEDLYEYPKGSFNLVAQLQNNHASVKEIVLPQKHKEVPFLALTSIKLAYFKKLFFEKFTLPITQLKYESNFLKGLKNARHAVYNLGYHIILLLAFIFIPLLSFDYGITWDEPVLVEYAEDILKYYSSGGENKEVFDMKKHARNATMHYSASFDVLAAVIHKYFSPFGIYETRHLLNAFMGVLAILFVGRIGRVLGSWRLGLLAILFMLLSPRYFGHSMNNPKDIPFLLGYAASIYYMIRFFKQLPNPSSAVIIWLTLSMAFMVSVKIGGLIVIGLFGLFSGIVWLYEGFANSWQTAIKYLPKYATYLLVIIFFSYFIGIWFWPWGYEKPFENPLISLTEFTNFRFLITYELFGGERINMDSPPWYYTFKWIGISAPIFVLVGFVFSLLPLIIKRGITKKAVFLMLIFSLFFPIIYTIVQNSTLYSGWRHLMFVYVPLVILAAAGWDYLFEMKQRWVPVAASVAVLALFVKPTYWMIKNHPNQYVYFNELIGGINGAYKEYETEYWCNSMKQAIDWLVTNENIGDKKIRVAANFEIKTAQYFANKYPEQVQMLWTRENEKYKQEWDYAFFGTRGMPKDLIEASFPPKGTIHSIKADTVPLLAIVKSENHYIAEAFKLRTENKRTEALEFAEKAVTFDPQNVEAQRIKGMLQIDLNINDEAISTLSKVIKLNPDDFVAYTLVGIAYNRKKQYEDAIKLFNKAIELKVNNSSGYLNRGRAYMALKKYNLALKNFETAAQYDNGRNPRIFVEASIALLQQGIANPQMKNNRFQLAIRNMKQALEMNPNQKDVYQNLVYAYRELGDETNALKYLKILEGK